MRALTIFLGLFAGTAFAHSAPNSTLRLEFRADAVHAEYWVPVSSSPTRAPRIPQARNFPPTCCGISRSRRLMAKPGA
jgi:hypothetical protein